MKTRKDRMLKKYQDARAVATSKKVARLSLHVGKLNKKLIELTDEIEKVKKDKKVNK